MLGGGGEFVGIVREQHDWAREIPAIECSAELAPGVGTEPPRQAIVDSGQIERAVAAPDRHPLVTQDAPAELAHLGEPGIDPRKVIVIAGDEERPVARLETAQWLDFRGEPLDTSVEHGAGPVGRSEEDTPEPAAR